MYDVRCTWMVLWEDKQFKYASVIVLFLFWFCLFPIWKTITLNKSDHDRQNKSFSALANSFDSSYFSIYESFVSLPSESKNITYFGYWVLSIIIIHSKSKKNNIIVYRHTYWWVDVCRIRYCLKKKRKKNNIQISYLQKEWLLQQRWYLDK